MSAFSIVLSLHSIVRWLVVITMLLALVRALAGWNGRRPWERMDDRAGMWFTMALDIQLALGLILFFFLSPITGQALRSFSQAMQNGMVRYFTVEHALLMVVAVVLAHVGRALSRRAPEARVKFRRAAIFYALAGIAILGAIPWPFMPYGRPLL